MIIIINILRTILSVLRNAWELIQGLAGILVKLLHEVYNAAVVAYSYADSLPDTIKDYALIIIGVSIFMIIVNRTGGKSSE